MKLIILDRDGVINQDRDDFVKSVDEWIPIEGSMDAIAFLTQAGYTIAVATNQSGIGRKYFTVQDLTGIFWIPSYPLSFPSLFCQKLSHVFGARSRFSSMPCQKVWISSK